MNRILGVGALFCCLLLVTAFGTHTLAATHTKKIYIGFLDDAREEMVNWKPGVAKDRVIRPAFEYNGSRWRNLDASSIPSQMIWTVAFDGKDFGEVKSAAVPIGGSSQNVQLKFLTLVQKILTPMAEIPSVGIPAEKYAPLGEGPTKGRRPLVVISEPNFRDPDDWRRLPQLPTNIARLVLAQFRHDFPIVDRCKEEEIVQRNWRFPASVLTFPIVYRSNKHSFLVKTDLNAGDCGYVDDPNDPLSNPWFFVSKDGTVRRIGSFMALLDAGDYNNSGGSELIFMVDQPEDREGFVLFDASLRKQATLLWSYH